MRLSWRLVALLGIRLLSTQLCFADAYDPPTTYYIAATGTGATLKSQLHTIVTTGESYAKL